MKNRIHMNPILKKELMVGSRSIKMSFAIMGINAFLTLIVVLVIISTNAMGGVMSYDYSSLSSLFPILGCTECGLISLIVPIITSGSISGERERQTLDIMLTTPVSPLYIAFGKLGSAMMVVMMYMITSIPVMAIAFVLGGMSWFALFGLIAMLLYLGIYVGSVGIFCSSVVKKSVMATILTIAIGVGIIVVTSVIFYAGLAIKAYQANLPGSAAPSFSPGAVPLVMMLNPYSPIFDFMLRAMSSASIYDIIKETGNISITLGNLYKYWIPVSIICNLLISFGFLKLAARNIAVTRNRKRK
ncbi:MAG: ABC transporter permease [Lachnospiraceae bacterium]|nr:ABC transporter permease [Lachnospiraceae bacterium]